MFDSLFKLKVIFCVRGVISPLLANIVLNYLDWQLHANRFKFVRYADDFVITCKTLSQTEEALDLVKPNQKRNSK